jgi:hypothetical protein
MLKNAIDRFVDGGLEFKILGLEIDKIHGSVLALHTLGGNTPNHPWLISQAVFLPKIIEANLQVEMASKASRVFCHISVFCSFDLSSIAGFACRLLFCRRG